jgi:hypothetical protein
MTELERALLLLGREIDWPEAPDVSDRLELGPRARRPRSLVLALAAVALAVAVAFAVPPARSAILRFLHLGGVTVERVSTLPPAEERPLTAGLGTRASPAEAALVLGHPFLLPPGARGAPLYQQPGMVSAVIATPEPTLLSELAFTGLLEKLAAFGTGVEPLQVAPGVDGLWLSGAQHVVFGPATPARLAGHVLLWERGGVTFRLEGRHLERERALELAREILGTSSG